MKKSKREDLLKSGWHFRSKFDRFARRKKQPLSRLLICI